MTNSLLVGVAFKRVHYRLGWKLLLFSSILEISSTLYLYFRSGLWKQFIFSFYLTLDYCILLNQANGSGSVTTTDHKIRFLAVHSSVPIRLTGKFVFALFLFYPNQCILLVGPPVYRIVGKSVGISCLLETVFNWIWLKCRSCISPLLQSDHTPIRILSYLRQ